MAPDYRNMKTFIIYNKPINQSYTNALESRDSFEKYKGWDVELFDGCNPSNLNEYQEMYKLKDIRAANKSASKKSCFYSHFHLWKYSSKNNVPIAIIENDTECLSDLPEINQEGVFHLSIETNIKCQAHGRKVDVDSMLISKKPAGIHKVEELSQKNLRTGKKCMPGSTAYVITPETAKVLIEDCETKGWYQNDSLITTDLVNLKYLKPSPVKYCAKKELKSSSSWKAD